MTLRERNAQLEAENARLRAALQAARVKHSYCDDSWYSCPKAEGGCADDSQGAECNCGADKHNAAIDAVLAGANEQSTPPKRDPFEQGGISDRLSNFDEWGDRKRERS